MNPSLSQTIAHDRERELRRDLTRARLVAIATCCRPSKVVATLRAVRTRLGGIRVESC